nr:hypothetical protein GCM10017745_01190 [Saccharothrix mutabilis subsp. capreolus]
MMWITSQIVLPRSGGYVRSLVGWPRPTKSTTRDAAHRTPSNGSRHQPRAREIRRTGDRSATRGTRAPPVEQVWVGREAHGFVPRQAPPDHQRAAARTVAKVAVAGVIVGARC